MARPAAHIVEDAAPPRTPPSPVRPLLQRLSATLMLPREHGAWAMLLMPYILGTLVAGWGGWPSFLLLASILILFIASRPLELALRDGNAGAVGHLVLYLLLGGGAGLSLLVAYQRWMLLPLGVATGAILGAQVLLRRKRLDRAWPSRLVSIAALAATGPASYYAASGMLDSHAFAVWAMACLYSGASVFYVRLYYRPPSKREDGRRQAEFQMSVYLVIAVGTMVVLAVAGWFPPLGTVVLAPVAVKVAMAWGRRDSRPSLKRIGMTEIGYSALFVALATLAFAAWK